MKVNSKVLFVGGLSLISLVTLIKWMLTGRLDVDNNPIPQPWTWPLLITYYVGLVSTCLAYYRIVTKSDQSDFHGKELTQIAIFGFVASFFMAPFLAADMAGYLAYGDIAQGGVFAYVDGKELLESRFIDLVSPHWKDCPNHYGPFTLLFFYLSVMIGQSYVGSLIVLKLFFMLFGLLWIYIINKLVTLNKGKYNVKALILLCPILFIQGVGQLHVDFIIATLLMATVYFLLQHRWFVASIFIGLVGACKLLYLAVFVPFLLAAIFIGQDKKIGPAILLGLGAIFVAVLTTAIWYWPVYDSLETLTTTINYHANKNPTNSIVKVAALILIGLDLLVAQFANLTSGSIDIDAIVTNFESIQNGYFDLSIKIFKYGGVLLATWNFLSLFYIQTLKQAFHLFAKILIIVVCFYSPQFYPWYLMIILPFLLFEEQESWIKYALLIFPFTLFYEVIYPSLNGVSSLVGLYLIFVFIMVFRFFKYFKEHFILETYRLIKGA